MRKLTSHDLTNLAETSLEGYHVEDKDAALRDFSNRDMDAKPFKVTITETLKLTVEVEAKDQHEAEQIVNDSWYRGDYILDADNFIGVEFGAKSDDGNSGGDQ